MKDVATGQLDNTLVRLEVLFTHPTRPPPAAPSVCAHSQEFIECQSCSAGDRSGGGWRRGLWARIHSPDLTPGIDLSFVLCGRTWVTPDTTLGAYDTRARDTWGEMVNSIENYARYPFSAGGPI